VRRSGRRYRRGKHAAAAHRPALRHVSTALASDAFRGGRLSARTAEATTGRTPAALAPGWRNVCGIIAVLTLAGTLATGTNSVLKLSEHQARTTGVSWRARRPAGGVIRRGRRATERAGQDQGVACDGPPHLRRVLSIGRSGRSDRCNCIPPMSRV
jgi:hypothetical protein